MCHAQSAWWSHISTGLRWGTLPYVAVVSVHQLLLTAPHYREVSAAHFLAVCSQNLSCIFMQHPVGHAGGADL